LSGKPGKLGNVRELYRCQGNVRNFDKSHGNVRELSGKKSCHGKCTLVHVDYLTCVSCVVEMMTEDCATFFHYSVAVDGTGFYDVITMM